MALTLQEHCSNIVLLFVKLQPLEGMVFSSDFDLGVSLQKAYFSGPLEEPKENYFLLRFLERKKSNFSGKLKTMGEVVNCEFKQHWVVLRL